MAEALDPLIEVYRLKAELGPELAGRYRLDELGQALDGLNHFKEGCSGC